MGMTFRERKKHERDLQVYRLADMGLTCRDIAATLNISHSTALTVVAHGRRFGFCKKKYNKTGGV